MDAAGEGWLRLILPGSGYEARVQVLDTDRIPLQHSSDPFPAALKRAPERAEMAAIAAKLREAS